MKKFLGVFASVSICSLSVNSVVSCHKHGIDEGGLNYLTYEGLESFFSDIQTSRNNHPEFELSYNGTNDKSDFYLPNEISEGQTEYRILYNQEEIVTFKKTIIDKLFDSENATKYGFSVERTNNNLAVAEPEIRYETYTLDGTIKRPLFYFNLEGLKIHNREHNQDFTLGEGFYYRIYPMPDDFHLSSKDVSAINNEISVLWKQLDPKEQYYERRIIELLTPVITHYLTGWRWAKVKYDLYDSFFLSFSINSEGYNDYPHSGLHMFDENGNKINDAYLYKNYDKVEKFKFKVQTENYDFFDLNNITCDDFIEMDNPYYHYQANE